MSELSKQLAARGCALTLQQQIFDYASRHTTQSEEAGQGSSFPTVRMAARRFNVQQQAIVEACEDYFAQGYLRIATGLSSSQGYAEFHSCGDGLIEAYA